MEELGCQVFAIVGLLLGILLVAVFALAFLWCVLCGIGFFAMVLLDYIFLGNLIPTMPFVGYAISGALIGGGIAFWSLAPAYGLREKRKWILAAPFVVMLALCTFSAVRMEPMTSAKAHVNRTR